jgi:hypothetical protein
MNRGILSAPRPEVQAGVFIHDLPPAPARRNDCRMAAALQLHPLVPSQ